MRSIYQEQQCAQSTDISSVEDGSRKESVATQTTQAIPSQIVVLTNYSPTLGASQLIYTASLMTVPDAVTRAAQSLLFSFLWKNKKDKIKRNVVCQPLENGGLNLINFEILMF